MRQYSRSLSPQAAAQVEIERRRRAAERRYRLPPTLISYARSTAPEWDWDAPHLVRLAEVCDSLRPGARQCIEIPIRHGKSELSTVRYAARTLIADPTTRVLIGSNTARLAKKFSRKIRKLVRAAGVSLNPAVQGVQEWETLDGGGVRAFGMGAATAGEGCDLLILDDPIANRKQASSAQERENIWTSITNDFLSRVDADGIVILTMARWHEEDPIGRIRDGQSGDAWTFLRLPGEAEEGDPLGRKPGEALWPKIWPLELLKVREKELGPIGYASLVQQAPQAAGGSMFKWEWWHLLDVDYWTVPLSDVPVRYWDTAGTEPRKGKHDPDWTVGTLMGRMPDGRFVVLDVARFRCGVGERDERMVEVLQGDVQRYGYGIRWLVETPTGQGSDKARLDLLNKLAGCALSFVSPVTDKETRAGPLSGHAKAGQLWLANGEWRNTFRDEMKSFPRGKHDDIVDATAGAFNEVALPSGSVTGITVEVG